MILAVKICQKQSFSGQLRSTRLSLPFSLSVFLQLSRLGSKEEMDIRWGVQAMPTGELNPEKQSSRCRNYLVEAARQGVRNMMDG